MVANQPAILDFALQKSGNQLPNIGYALMFPVALISKIVFVQILYLILAWYEFRVVGYEFDRFDVQYCEKSVSVFETDTVWVRTEVSFPLRSSLLFLD